MTMGEDVTLETNTYMVNKTPTRFGGVACCFDVSSTNVVQQHGTVSYKAFRTLEEYNYAKLVQDRTNILGVQDRHNLMGASRLLQNINE
jgi:hypothetical protein